MPVTIRGARRGGWLWSLFEFLPLIVFSNASRLDFELEERFLAGAGTVLVVVAVAAARRTRMNPLLVGVHAWFLLVALSFLVYVPFLVETLKTLQEASLFLAIIVAGGIRVLRSKSLLTAGATDFQSYRRDSLLLLGLAGAAFVFALAVRGNELTAGVIPSVILFAAQAFASARARRAAR